MIKIKNLLVPTDFSDNSIPALDFGQYLALHNNACLHLAHVIEDETQTPFHNKNGLESDQERSLFMNAEEELRRFLYKVPPAEIIICEIMLKGDPAEEIVNYAAIHDMDMIVISTHGQTGMTHTAMGETTKKVLSESEVPVICINPKAAKLKSKSGEYKTSWAENWVG
jgi:nucleotide-binding universal stress UspA family protein